MKRFSEEIVGMSLTDLITLKNYLDAKAKIREAEGAKAFEFITASIEREINKRVMSWVAEVEHEWAINPGLFKEQITDNF